MSVFQTCFLSQDTKQDVLLSSWIMDDVINFKIYLQSSSKAKAVRKKRKEDRHTKI